MRLITWNINSVRLRLETLGRLFKLMDPDVVCLQETKVIDELFPADAIAEMGYPHQAISGMKSYNGVAILSRLPIENWGTKNWAGKNDCRHIHAQLEGGLDIHNFYIPAGGDVPDPTANDKFAHKLEFLKSVSHWWADQQDPKARRIMVGDFNVAPLETDVWSHKQLLKIVSHTPVEVDLLNAMQAAGPWIDAVREIIPAEKKLYSWWSYRGKDWAASDRGRRLDHIWITGALAPKLLDASVAREVRGWERPSDHAPVAITLDI
ncbi:MAG: exodeoxyribonuclease III [Rhodospirillales bacterium]|nr:exodeoxyribonuclease III [Rhodospirillales bacterium]